MPGPVRLRRPGLGLRGRVALAFALMALVLSGTLSVTTWLVVTRQAAQESLTSAQSAAQVDREALHLAFQNGASADEALALLPAAGVAGSQVRMRDRWTGDGILRVSDIAPDLVAAAAAAPVRRVVQISDVRYVLVGLPLGGGDLLVQISSLADDDALARDLGIGLLGASLATTAAGLGLGRAAGRVALRPLTQLNAAAGEVLQGHLQTRFDGGGDRDLDALAGSLNQTLADLEHRVASDARFAADVSHELRTPLTTMLNSIQVVQHREAQLPPVVRESVTILAEEVQRFRTLVVDLLEMARPDAGDSAHLESSPVADLVRQAADGTARRPVTRVEGRAGDVVLTLDRRRLERVVSNLVANAEEHGGSCTAVTVRTEAAELLIEVEDDGPGIPAELRARVFERFARGGTERSEAGVGLGLAIVQRHVTLMGGHVQVGDAPSGGARFVVRLPLAAPGYADPT